MSSRSTMGRNVMQQVSPRSSAEPKKSASNFKAKRSRAKHSQQSSMGVSGQGQGKSGKENHHRPILVPVTMMPEHELGRPGHQRHGEQPAREGDRSQPS